MKRFIIAVFIIMSILSIDISANEPSDITLNSDKIENKVENIAEEFLQNSDTDELYKKTPTNVKEYLNELGISSISVKSILKLTPIQVFKLIFCVIKDYLNAPFIMLIQIVAVIIISSILSNFGGNFFDKNITSSYMVAATISISVICIKPLIECIEKSASVITESSIFLSSFIPIFAGVMTASGQAVSGTIYNMIIFGSAQAISQFATTYLVPLLTIFMAFSLISSVCVNINFSAATKSIKTFVSWIMVFLLTLFVGILTIQGIVASSADGVATKTTKFLLGSFVPVVGSALSDALNSVYGCMKLIKSTVGVYGIIASALIFLPIITETLLMMCSVKLAVIISEISGTKALNKLLSSALDVLSILIGMLFCFVLFTIVSTTIVLIMGISV
ncbi:MAG: hypothetical protein IJC83_04655 [Oscillospiraceae bacterium]|nr:hypothetical protein [Oscillospiraceae bacterium]